MAVTLELIIPPSEAAQTNFLADGAVLAVSPSTRIFIPGYDPAEIDYTRDGSDLIVSLPDGQSIRLQGFLADVGTGDEIGGITDADGNLVDSVIELGLSPAAGPPPESGGETGTDGSSQAFNQANTDPLGNDFGRSAGSGATGGESSATGGASDSGITDTENPNNILLTSSSTSAPAASVPATPAVNVAPVTTPDDSAAIEDTPPNPVVGNVLTNDSDADGPAALSVSEVNGAAANVGAAVAGTFGSLTLLGDGSYEYTLDNTLAAVQALAAGAQVQDIFTYQAFDGVDGTDSTLAVTITGTNDAPLVDLDVDDSSGAAGGDFTAGTFTEGGPALSLADLDRDISDVDNATIASLTLTLAVNPDGVEETIAATAAGTGLIITQVSNTQVQVTGAGSLADFEAVLGTLTYNNTSQNPTAGARSVTAVTNDGADGSATATANFVVAGDNDAPAVDLDADDSNTAGLGFDAGSYARGNPPLALVDTDASVTDIDSQIQTLTVTFSAAPPDGASEQLAVTLERIAISLKHSLLQTNRVNPLYLYSLEQDSDGRSIRPHVILL